MRMPENPQQTTETSPLDAIILGQSKPDSISGTESYTFNSATNADPASTSISLSQEYFPEVAKEVQAASEHDSIVAKYLNERDSFIDSNGRIQKRVNLANDGLRAVKAGSHNPRLRPLIMAGVALAVAACSVSAAPNPEPVTPPPTQGLETPAPTQSTNPTPEATNSPLPSSTAEATPSVSPSPEPTDTLSTLQQNLQDWLDGKTDIDPLQGVWFAGTKSTEFGLNTNDQTQGSNGDIHYLVYYLGAQKLEGTDEIIAWGGMKDKDGKPYLIPFRAGTSYPGDYFEIDLVPTNQTSDFSRSEKIPTDNESLLDSKYTLHPAMIVNPIENHFQKDSPPYKATELELDAAKSLYKFTQATLTQSYTSIDSPPWFLNVTEITNENYTSLPYFWWIYIHNNY